MIDTDKYEGHTPAEKWAKVVWGKNPRHESKGELPTCLVLLNMDENGKETYATLTDQILMADAPLLLEEVKQLREQLAKANKFVYSICQHSDSMLMDYEDYMKGDD